MISIVELLAILSLAGILAQCVAWLIQRVSSGGLMPQAVAGGAGKTERSVARSSWGEATRADFRYIRRRPRYVVNCPVTYQVDHERVEGLVVDMAREGWRIRGNGPVSVGTMMSLGISLPGHPTPVPISQAVVRWSDSEEFGISLVTLDLQPAVQLAEFFSSLTPIPRRDLSAA